MSQGWWGSKLSTIAWILVIFLTQNGDFFARAATLESDLVAMQDLRRGMNVVLNWYNGDPCDSAWQGVTCDDSRTRITGITLTNMRLSGSLPSSIGNLTALQSLDLPLNKNLRGPIPSSVGFLVNLVRLNLQNCGFSGSIPRQIGSLTGLSFLALNGNFLSGRIPPTIGQLQSLVWCDLSNNELDGELPVSSFVDTGFDNLTVLKHMHLNNNNLSGPIPVALSTMPELLHLVLDNNNFSGTIPPEIGNFPQLRILRLDNNKLEGPVPETISRLPYLFELHLTNNPLNGSLPDLSDVENLQLIRSGNVNFSPSEIPTWLLNMAKLKTLEFYQGNLFGQIPTALFSLPSLEATFLDENRLNGSIDFSTASGSLEVVSLEENEISSVTSVSSALTVRLSGNPVCNDNNSDKFCLSNVRIWKPSINQCGTMCDDQKTLQPATCSCAYPLICTIQFITPSFSAITVDRIDNVTGQLSSALNISRGQIWIGSADFTSNHRLVMNIIFFPPGKNVFLDPSSVSKIILLLSIQRVSVPEFGPMLLTNANQPERAPQVAAKQTKFMFVVTLCSCVGVSAAIAGLCIFLIVMKRKRKRSSSHDYGFSSIGEIAPKFKGCRWFTLDELRKASNNFSSNHLIGVGGYGKVYKGQLQTGEVVAIKRAEKESLQGLEEFRTEIELFSRLHHKNLVNLIGFCTDDGQQMLVYEFMPNRTLRDHLYASNSAEQALNWKTRLSIALGSAKGLEYLHELADPPIIHRDIKSSNILLDENLVAKVADLGLSKLAPTCSEEKTYTSVQVKGTLGYLDPEYYAYHQLSAKSDVYSFGVVLIEIITGKQPIDSGSFIVKEIKESVAWGGVASLLSFVDKRLLDEATVEQVKKYFRLALQCVEDSGQDRPKMNEVVKKLEEIIKLQEVHGSIDHEQNGDSNVKEATGESSFDVGALNPELYAWSSDDAEDPTFQAFGFTAPGERRAGLDRRCTVED